MMLQSDSHCGRVAGSHACPGKRREIGLTIDVRADKRQQDEARLWAEGRMLF